MRFKLLVTSFILLITAVVGFAFANVPSAYAALSPGAKEAACDGITDTTGGQCDDGSGGSGLDRALTVVLNLFSVIAGIIAVVMVLVGGVKFITSQGDATKTAGARNTILYALAGLLVVALAQIIVRFVLNKATTPPAPVTKTIETPKAFMV